MTLTFPADNSEMAGIWLNVIANASEFVRHEEYFFTLKRILHNDVQKKKLANVPSLALDLNM